MHEIGDSTFSPEIEQLLLDILQTENKIDLLPPFNDGPHSMPPEDMLKSFAIQTLVKRTGLAYQLEILKVKAISPALSGIIEHILKKDIQS